MGEMREFVYLNDESLNSSLSSLGRGLPSEVVQSSEGESETGANAGGTFLGIGAEGQYNKLNRSAVETTMQVTAPYRFQDLREALRDEDITVHENPDPRSLARGDVVQISGDAKPMSLFKIEVAIESIGNLVNQDMKESLETLQEIDEADVDDDSGLDDENLQQINAFSDMVESFIGDRVPLRFVGSEHTYATTLHRSKMRIPPSEAFLEEEDYKLFGRVERRISRNNTWDPIQAISIMRRYLPDNPAPENLREALEQIADAFNMPVEDEDWELGGHTAVIHPIAVFW